MAYKQEVKSKTSKESILKISKQLFYNHGYKNTTMRMISSEADINLGLITYHYKNKAEIGLLIYHSIRMSIRENIENDLGENTVMSFLTNATIELKLLLTHETYRNLYSSIARDDSFMSYIQNRILNYFKMHYLGDEDPYYVKYSCTTLSVIKPELVRSITSHGSPDQKEMEALIKYYLKTYVEALNQKSELIDKVLLQVEKYHIDMAKNFTPVIVKTW